MYVLPAESVTRFRDTYKTVLLQGKKQPVLLLQHSQIAAVLVDPDQWNAMVEKLASIEELEDQVAIYRHKWLTATGQIKLNPLSDEEAEAWLAEDDQETEATEPNKVAVSVPN